MDENPISNALDIFLESHRGKIPDVGEKFLRMIGFSENTHVHPNRVILAVFLQAMTLSSQEHGDSLLEYMIGEDSNDETLNIEKVSIDELPGAELATNKNIFLLEIVINGRKRFFTINIDKSNHTDYKDTPVARESKVLRLHREVLGQRAFGTTYFRDSGRVISIKNFIEGVPLEMLLFDKEYTVERLGFEVISKIARAVRKKINDITSEAGGLPADMHFGNIIVNVEPNGEVSVGICDVESINKNPKYIERVARETNNALNLLVKAAEKKALNDKGMN